MGHPVRVSVDPLKLFFITLSLLHGSPSDIKLKTGEKLFKNVSLLSSHVVKNEQTPF